jgi:hypothetical protein
MTTTTVATILNGAVTALGNTFAAYLPVIIPVAIALAGLFAILYWIRGAAHRT